MWGLLLLLLLLLAAWILVSIVGLVLEGLFWLFLIGVILIIATAVFGWIKRRV